MTGLILPHAIGRLASVNPVEELVQVMFQSCEPASLLRRGNAEPAAQQSARIIDQTRLLREVLLHRRGDDAESAELQQRQIAIDAERRGLVYMT